MSNNIQFEHAYHNQLKEAIHISDVTTHNKDNLNCPTCNEIFIPVLNHPTPHFRHKPHSDCKANLESHIHWLSKEAFKNIKEISFPPIYTYDLPNNLQTKLDVEFYNYIDQKIPFCHARDEFLSTLKGIISDYQTLTIQKVEIEKTYKTKYGNVRIDVVLTINNQQLFIEPYYSNPISEEKLKKLKEINIPTISIPLIPYLVKHHNTINIETLQDYIQSRKSKEWSFIRPSSLDKHIKNYYKYIDDKIFKNQRLYDNMKHNYTLLEKLDLMTEETQKSINKLQSYQSAISYQRHTIIKYPKRNHKKLHIIENHKKQN